LKFLREECDLHVVLMNHGELETRLAALGIDLTVLDESQLNSWGILNGIRKAIVCFRPDVIHTHRQKENIIGCLANVLSTRAKSVRTSHGAPESKPKKLQKIQVALDKFVGKYLQHAVIAVSADLAEQLQKIFPAQKVHVVHNGVDVQSLRAATEVSDLQYIHSGAVNVGIIGRLEPVKRIDLFLEMASIIIERQAFADIQFHVIGDGRLKRSLQRQCDQLGLKGKVIFHGHVENIKSYIKALDAIVMPSDHEGTPMTALEALAIGTPLIAHNVGGLREILQDYPEWLVDHQHPADYADSLIKLLNGRDGSIHLARHYEASQCAKATIHLYRQLLI